MALEHLCGYNVERLSNFGVFGRLSGSFAAEALSGSRNFTIPRGINVSKMSFCTMWNLCLVLCLTYVDLLHFIIVLLLAL